MSRLKIYGDPISGNCYKLQLVCAQLEIDYDWHNIDVVAGEARSDEFLRLNPNGKVPLLVTEDGRCLPESNAILWYLAADSPLAGADRFAQASAWSWMCFEQYYHEPFIATSRFIVRFLNNPPEKQAALDRKRVGGYRALDLMEAHLGDNDFFVDNTHGIADIALFAYTHVAPEGGFDLADYPNINAWLDRVRATKKFVAMGPG